MKKTIHLKSSQKLQKNAAQSISDEPPRELLNPIETAQHYYFRIYPPHPDLTPFVDYYWIMRWDLIGKDDFTAEVIPSPYTNLTFMPEGVRITGVTTGKYDYILTGKGAIVGVKFKSGGLRAFYSIDISTITDKVVDARSAFSSISPDDHTKVMSMTDTAAVQYLDALLLAKTPISSRNLELITSIMSYIEESERPNIQEIVETTHLSSRRLHEIFREYVGVGIKHTITRSRLLKAVTAAPHARNWTTIAVELGYADQSHFINDFKRIIGKTPKEYASGLQQNKE